MECRKVILIAKCKKAFSLAEILVTLIVIGIIASLTIPGLIQQTQDAQFKSSWKDSLSSINQAMKLVLLNNGGNIRYICADWNPTCLRDLFAQYFSYIRSCNTNLWVIAGIIMMEVPD